MENRGDTDYSDLYPLIWPWLYSWILYYKWVEDGVGYRLLRGFCFGSWSLKPTNANSISIRWHMYHAARNYAKFNFSNLQYFWYFARTFFCDCGRLAFLAGPFKFLFNFNYNTFSLHYIQSTGQATAGRAVKHGNQNP